MSSGHSTADIQSHIKVYMTVFAVLAALTIITVAASYLDLSTGEAIFLALTIASVKGSLVASYFMHLISESINYVDTDAYSWFLFCTHVYTNGIIY